MLKNLKIYLAIAALLHGGHFILAHFLPEKISVNQVFLTQSFIFIFFVISDFLTRVLVKHFNLIIGQAFLTFSTVKLLASGTYILILKKLFEVYLNKWFIVLFMLSYFVYLGVELMIFLKLLKATETNG